MGALVGLVAGAGLLLIWRSGPRSAARRRDPGPARRPGWKQRMTEHLVQAGLGGVTPLRLVLVAGGCALVTLLVAAAISGSITIALAFAGFAAAGPFSLVRHRRRERRVELRALWPEAVDNLSSAVRAGMSLPEALTGLGERGPQALRPAFAQFGADYRATGRFDECLDRLKESLADPVGDRIVEAVRLAREVGGHDLGRLLRTLSAFLREDARTRGELESRQSWTVSAARLAMAAPWILLALLALRPEAVAAYNSAAGAAVLLVGAAVSIAAYRVMLRIGRLPEEARVLR